MTRKKSIFSSLPPIISTLKGPRARAGLVLFAFAFTGLVGVSVLPVTAAEAAAPVTNSSAPDFGREVLPILSDKCFVCHGPDADKDEVRLDSYEGATEKLGGGVHAIDPKDLAKSELIYRIHDKDDPMPPEDADKQLTPRERDVLKRWVESGGKYEKHWSFVKPVKIANGSIDSLIEKKLTAKGHGHGLAKEASPNVLARRVALILTGLPPEPAQLDRFLKSGNYEGLVDELLASERYGEHQARYWLDAVRYGDTHGLHLDNRRGIYPYRDWVVKAFNDNLPFDQFITWQLAGDLLEDPSLEQLVATGYVRMNPSTAEGGAIKEEFQAKNSFDRTENFGTVFLGMTMNCVRCHTHKYDSILHEEYYQLMAFFNNTSESPMDGNKYEYKPIIKAPASAKGWKQWAALEEKRNTLVTNLGKNQTPEWNKLKLAEKITQAAKPKEGSDFPEELVKEAKAAHAETVALEKGFTTTLIAGESKKKRETRILLRGEYTEGYGEPLTPGTLKMANPFPKDAPRNRLGLAQWTTSRENPLVSRVLVNRIWQLAFGEGLVRSPEDFGVQGQQPSHPELLDWLAVEFQDQKWDRKKLLKNMVMSRTFRQDSARRAELNDPQNLLFARGPSFRLDAEVIRDIGLWAGGLLENTPGGEGIKPYQPDGLWAALAHPGSNTKKYVPDQDKKIFRRSIYVYWKRTSPHPMMSLFDAPSREVSCVRRSRSNTPLQSLGLFNEPQRVAMAKGLAQRLMTESKEDSARIKLLYTWLSSRDATPTEQKICQQLLQKARDKYKADPKAAEAFVGKSKDALELAAWSQLTGVILASDANILLY